MSEFNNKLGGILIIAGTSIGAGMLALPISCVNLGLINSLLLMLPIWILMLYTALVTVEINLVLKNNHSIVTIVKQILGIPAYVISLFSLVALFYSLISAYISGLTSIIQENVFETQGNDFYRIEIAVALSIGCGLIVYVSTKAVDYSNRIFLIFKSICFILLIFALLPHLKVNLLLNHSTVVNKSMAIAIPIFFASFGFHGSISSIMQYINNRKVVGINSVFVIGSLIPLVIYSLWLMVTLGTIEQDSQSWNQGLNSFLYALDNVSGNALLHQIIAAFSWFAIVTSLLGVTIGLFDFFIELLKYSKKSKLDKFKALLYTFVIPIVFVLLNSHLFVKALAFASMALSILAVIMPCLVALRIKENSLISNDNYKFIFIRKPFLILSMFFGLFVIFIELVNLLSN